MCLRKFENAITPAMEMLAAAMLAEAQGTPVMTMLAAAWGSPTEAMLAPPHVQLEMAPSWALKTTLPS